MFSGAIGASISSMVETGKRTEEYSGNIANSDTVGYKGFEAHASSIVNSSGTSSGGVTSVTRHLVDQQGKMKRTDVSTDLAIDGHGFFVVTNKVNDDNTISNFSFTKAGSFRRNEHDQFANAAGYLLTAWPVDADGNLPVTKSLTSSLEAINVRQLVSEASSTTNMDFGANLKANQKVVGNGVTTINITNSGTSGSPANYSISSTDVLFPNSNNSLTKGDGLDFEVDGVHKKIIYGGYGKTFSFTSSGVDLAGTAGDDLQIQVGTRSHTGITRGSGATNIAVLENIAKQINATSGDQSVKARVYNDGTTSTLLVSPDKAEYSMTFSGNLAFRNSMGLSDAQNVEQFVVKSGSDIVGRFASLGDLSNQLKKIGFESEVFNSEAIGSAITFKSTLPVAINNYIPSGAGSDFLTEFGLSKGFLNSSYDPYDAKNNIAGGTFKPHFSRDFPVYDSMGNKHDMLVGFMKLDTNKWGVEIFAIDPSQVDIPGRTDGVLQAGIVTFDGKGHLTSLQGTTQAVKSNEISTPQDPLGATEGQTFTTTIGSTTHSFTYGNMTAASAEFTSTATGLNGTATDELRITIGATTHNVARGAGATNLDVLRNMVSTINTTSGADAAKADLVYNKSTDKYKIVVRADDITKAAAFTENPVTTLGTDVGITATQDISAASFESLYELAEQINMTTGPDAIVAKVVTGSTSGAYQIKIEPKNPSLYMSFGGAVASIGVPLGTGVSEKIHEAMGLTNTSSAKQLAALNQDLTVNWASTVGADPNIITTNFGDIGSTNGLGQVAGDYAIKKIDQNGVSTGQLNGIQVDREGFIIATFTNTQTRKIYKMAIADFANPNGLMPSDGNSFTIGKDSGALNLKEAGLDGAGKVLSGTLEGSNIDIADQLTKLILAQRQYQASSKVINVVDRLLEDLIHRTFS